MTTNFIISGIYFTGYVAAFILLLLRYKYRCSIVTVGDLFVTLFLAIFSWFVPIELGIYYLIRRIEESGILNKRIW